MLNTRKLGANREFVENASLILSRGHCKLVVADSEVLVYNVNN